MIAAGSRGRAAVRLLGQEGGRDRPLAPRGLRDGDRTRLPARRPMSATVTEPFRVRSLEVVAETDAHEGPVYAADEHALYFTSVRRGTHVAIKRLELATGRVGVVRERHERRERHDARPRRPAGRLRAGHARRARAHQPPRSRRPARPRPSSTRCGGLPLNSPNDVVVARDGTIWFTDPSYGYLQGFRPSPQRRRLVYRYDPATGRLDGRRRPTSTSRTGSRSRPTSASLYVARQRREPRARQLRPATAAPHPRLRRRRQPPSATACSRSRRRASPTASRSTRTAASTPRRSPACRCFDPAGGCVGEIRAAGRRQLHLRRPRRQRPLHHHRHGRLGRRARTRKERDPCQSSAPAAIIDDAGADSRHRRPPRERARRERVSRVVIAVVDPSGELVAAAPHRGRAGRELARRRRQGPHRRDLRPAEPRDRGAGQRRPPRRARAARRGGADRRHPAERRRRGRRRDRHERRDARRGRGDLDRRRRRRVLDDVEVPALTYEGARLAAEAVGRRRGPARRRARRRRRSTPAAS